MLNEKKKNMKFRFSGIILFCMVLVGSMLLMPATAQAARGRRGGRRASIAGRRGGFRRHNISSRRFNRVSSRRFNRGSSRRFNRVSSRRFNRGSSRRFNRGFARRHHRPIRRHHRHGTDWVNFGLSVGNLAWTAANIASISRDYDYYDDPVIIEMPVYVVPPSYDDDTDYIILRNWDYAPTTTTTRTEIIISP